MSVRAYVRTGMPLLSQMSSTQVRARRGYGGAFEAPSYQRRSPARSLERPAGPPVCYGMAPGSEGILDGAGRGERTDHSWGFLALWEWNDAWTAATRAERRAYDEQCDVAFRAM